jgi:MEMO1 family protein
LGPSHHVYLDGCALSKCTEYATPLGALPLDRPSMLLCLVSSSGLTSFFLAIEELKKTGKFSEMELGTDEDEHSIEMHLPYVRKIFEEYVTPFSSRCS